MFTLFKWDGLDFVKQGMTSHNTSKSLATNLYSSKFHAHYKLNKKINLNSFEAFQILYFLIKLVYCCYYYYYYYFYFK